MNFTDPSTALLAAAGGHTVKLFDASVDSGDPCVMSYTPSPGFQVNSVKWNHTSESLTLSSATYLYCLIYCYWLTRIVLYFYLSGCWFADLVVASAGDDKKISLWRKNGESMGTIPMAGTEVVDNIEVSFTCLFSYQSGVRTILCAPRDHGSKYWYW